MKLADLAEEFAATRSPGWLVISCDEITACLIEAARTYAAFGDIASISATVQPQSAAGAGQALPAVPEPEAEVVQALPIRNLKLIKESTSLSTAEWAMIRPLFWLYAERENALRLEASRGMGIEPHGRQVSEITADIREMESITLPSAAFVSIPISV